MGNPVNSDVVFLYIRNSKKFYLLETLKFTMFMNYVYMKLKIMISKKCSISLSFKELIIYIIYIIIFFSSSSSSFSNFILRWLS